MNTEQLTKMVNDIALFFASESGPVRAVDDVASHMKRFWDPRMRREIVAHYAKGGEGLSEISRKAVAELARAAHQ
ncbi:MAG: formate dehydrogenase subunit delta [Proteobacteria bacterium]|nr:formate dehydrogenase subunit delta [Pseudomonadota bacterium]